MSLIEARRYDAVIGNLRQLLEGDAKNQATHWFLYDTYRRKGALQEAAQEWERASLLSGDKESAESVRRAFGKGGYKAVLLWRLRDLKLEAAKHYVSPVNLALQYAQLGQREETLAFLEQVQGAFAVAALDPKRSRVRLPSLRRALPGDHQEDGPAASLLTATRSTGAKSRPREAESQPTLLLRCSLAGCLRICPS